MDQQQPNDTPPNPSSSSSTELDTPSVPHRKSSSNTSQSSQHSFTQRLIDRGVAVPSSFSNWNQKDRTTIEDFMSPGSVESHYGMSPFITPSSFNPTDHDNDQIQQQQQQQQQPLYYKSLRQRYEKEKMISLSSLGASSARILTTDEEDELVSPGYLQNKLKQQQKLKKSDDNNSDIELSDEEQQQQQDNGLTLPREKRSGRRSRSPLSNPPTMKPQQQQNGDGIFDLMKPENYDDIPFYASTQKHNEHIKQLLLPTTVKKPSPPKPLPTPPRRHLLHTPVFQVVNANTVKDRYLFLFSDLLLICKPIMDENIIVSNPDNNRYRFRPNQSSLFQVKNIVQLGHLTLYVSKEDVYNQQIQKEQELYPTVQLDKDGRPILPPARKIHPILASALRKFEVNPQLGIQYLIDKRILTDDPLSIANFLFKTPDLNRRQLGYYLAMTTSREIYDAFLECFRLVGLRLDEALRILLTTFRLPSQWESLEYLIERFAKKWHDANQNVIKFHEDMVVKVVVAMLFLNAEYWYDASSERDVFWYAREVKERQDGDQQRRGRMGTLPSSTTAAKGSVANAPLHYIMSMRASGQTTKPTLVEFLDRWNYYDQYRLVPREFMEEMYKSIVDERLETGWDSKKSTTIATSTTSTTTVAQQHDVVITVIPHRLPSRLTKGIPSSPITITIPKPDKGLQIKLRGQDLVFEPNVLDFSTSCIQTFRMTGFTLGRTSLMLIKTGENASKYVSPTLPRTKSVVVERPFMRYTFQIGFPPQQDVKKWMVEQKVIEKKSQQQQKQQQRKYTFSVETESERQEWVEMLKRLSGHVNEERNETSLETLEKMSSEARVALQVLKEVLLADEVKKGTSLPPGGEKESGTTSSVHERTMRLLLPTKKKEDRKSLMTTTTNVVTKRGHEIVKLVVQNSMVPLVLGFLKSQIPNH